MSRPYDQVFAGHILVSIAAFLLVTQTSIIHPVHPYHPVNPVFKLFVCCSTFLIYRLAYHGLAWPFSWLNLLRKKEVSISVVLVILLIPFLSMQETVSFFIMFVCCLVYFAEFKGWKGLRSIPVLKSLWLALIWTIITVAIPLYENFDHDAMLIFAERFLFMLSLCIIYNLRDNTLDLTKGFRTIAGVIGATGTKKISLALLSLNAIVIFMHHYNFAISLAFIVSLIATAFIILLAKEDGHPLYYSFAVDASMIVQSVLVLIAYYSV